MKRREFITMVGGFASLPLLARAQKATRPVIGFLGAATAAAMSKWADAFVKRMAELGWVDGQTIAIEYRWAEGRIDRAVEIASEFVKLNVSAIVTAGVGPSQAASRATSEIPIVFAVNSDPIGSGTIKSLPRPGGNVTGLSIQSSDLSGKRIELLRHLVPNVTEFAILGNGADPGAMLQIQSVEALAPALGLTILPLRVRTADDIDASLASIKGRAKALFVCADPFLMTNRERIFSQTTAAGLPTMADLREFVLAGATMSYGPNFADMFRRAADYVDKILRGARPEQLPVQQPTVFDFVVSVPNARALGLDVPPILLVLANEVIE
ncbi:MAG: ABC transporter substrate-binding protein [Pseudorhodoplanes sp.]|uniref:ABC transporter substrate-binding protein n=1 Tax=Pseudorhodoplanes sp. TaxID=1934341 RepID=UPI003D0E724A